jgi:hypothetical protein
MVVGVRGEDRIGAFQQPVDREPDRLDLAQVGVQGDALRLRRGVGGGVRGGGTRGAPAARRGERQEHEQDGRGALASPQEHSL